MPKSGTLVKDVVEILHSTLLSDKKPIPLHEPEFSGNEWKYVKECIDTGWVSSVGSYVDLFERTIEDFTGAKHAVATVNGTTALHLCLLLVGTKMNDEVLVPSLTFVATPNAVTYCGGIPHFIDSAETTLGVDPNKLDIYLKEISEIRKEGCFNKCTGRRIHAIVPMHTFGHPVDLDPLVEICNRYKLNLVEDAAESLGSYYKGKHTGTFGQVSSLSFNGNKIVTTGGGGAILTNDSGLAKLAKHLTTTARIPHKWSFVHDMVGFNYRLPNLNAALGCAQMEQLPKFIADKRNLADKYKKAFSGVQGIHFFSEPAFAKSNYWLNVLLLEKDFENSRDDLLEATSRSGIMTRPAWTLMHKLEMYNDCPRMDNLRTCESLEEQLINIPSSAVLGTNNG